MLSLESFRKLLPFLKIAHRETGALIPFELNNCQRMIMHALYKLRAQNRPLWIIVPKSRRVGVSTFASALGFAQGLAMANARILTVAHLADSSSALFETPQQFVASFPIKLPTPTQKKIFIPHRGGMSIMRFATAGAVESGRALRLSTLHFSEAANIKDPNAFSSLLPALSYHISSIRIIESTPRGKQGPGAEFYERCEKARRGISEEELVFLSWLDDPGCVRDPEEADDAPATDIERELMQDFGATKAQIAWSRWCFETQCNGIENRFFSEYPYCYDVAFTSSAYPAFEHDEIKKARRTVREPVARGYFDLEDGKPKFKPSRSGTWLIWENPIDGHEYFLGADAARGKLSADSEAIGDFAAVAIFDGSTGRQVARFADRISPDTFSRMICASALAYNSALVNIELTGGWGRWAQKELRDTYFYPNLYGWKGKDDKMVPKSKVNLAGWETTSASRDRMYNAFRAKLRANAITIRDEELLRQMSGAEMFYGRWEVEKMHDDILVAAFLAVVAISDYAPIEVEDKGGDEESETVELSDDIILGSEPQQAVMNHWNGIQYQIENGGMDDAAYWEN